MLCTLSFRASYPLCPKCLNLIPRLTHYCHRCGQTLLPEISNLCTACESANKDDPSALNRELDRLWIAAPFQEPIRTLIHQLKYHEAIFLTPMLADFMLSAFSRPPLTQVFIPVPMHRDALRRRGYNQSWLLTQKLAQRTKTPCSQKILHKLQHSEQQAKLSAEQRRENLKQHFHVTPHAYHHVTLVDDVYTTGSTVKELARVLKLSGVHTVHAWCLARTV